MIDLTDLRSKAERFHDMSGMCLDPKDVLALLRDYERMQKVIAAVDTMTWALAIKGKTRKGQKCKVDYKGAIDDVLAAYSEFYNGDSIELTPGAEGKS